MFGWSSKPCGLKGKQQKQQQQQHMYFIVNDKP